MTQFPNKFLITDTRGWGLSLSFGEHTIEPMTVSVPSVNEVSFNSIFSLQHMLFNSGWISLSISSSHWRWYRVFSWMDLQEEDLLFFLPPAWGTSTAGGRFPVVLHMSAVRYFVLLGYALVWMDSSLFIPGFLALGTTATGPLHWRMLAPSLVINQWMPRHFIFPLWQTISPDITKCPLESSTTSGWEPLIYTPNFWWTLRLFPFSATVNIYAQE